MFIAFRLKEGRDDDIISWVESLGERDRSYSIRQALKEHLSEPHSPVLVKKHRFPKEKPVETQNDVNVDENLDSWL